MPIVALEVLEENYASWTCEPMSKKPTIKDVANLADVSMATVSRVMTGSSRVNKEFSVRVRKAAHSLGMDLTRRPNDRVLAFILSNRSILHAFHSRLLVEAESVCSLSEWSMLFLRLSYSPTVRWRDLTIPPLANRRPLISGFILAGMNFPNLLERLNHESSSFAVLGNNVVGEWQPEGHDVVWFDDIQGAIDVTRYLQSLGHRNIWFVGNTRLSWFARRYEGYCQAMREAGLAPHLSGVDTETDFDLGYLAARSLLARNSHVTAILAGADDTAEGVYTALRDCGLRVPEDISVAGFNDLEAPSLHPSLTTVRVFTDQIGKSLAQMVINRIERPDIESQHLMVPTQLVRRDSCLTRAEVQDVSKGEDRTGDENQVFDPQASTRSAECP